MGNYMEMHYSAFKQSDYHKYKNLFRKVLDYEYNSLMKYEVLRIKKGKTLEDVERIERQIEEQEKESIKNIEEDEGNYFLHYYE